MSKQEKSDQNFSTRFWMLTNQQLGHKPVAPFSVAHHFYWPFMLPVKMKIVFYFTVDLIESMMCFLMCFRLYWWQEWVCVPFTKSITAVYCRFQMQLIHCSSLTKTNMKSEMVVRACTPVTWHRINLQGYGIFHVFATSLFLFSFVCKTGRRITGFFRIVVWFFIELSFIIEFITKMLLCLEFYYNSEISS